MQARAHLGTQQVFARGDCVRLTREISECWWSLTWELSRCRLEHTWEPSRCLLEGNVSASLGKLASAGGASPGDLAGAGWSTPGNSAVVWPRGYVTTSVGKLACDGGASSGNLSRCRLEHTWEITRCLLVALYVRLTREISECWRCLTWDLAGAGCLPPLLDNNEFVRGL